MDSNEVPVWAQELIREVTILNERLPNHIDYTVRNLDDHERRIRFIERWFFMIVAGATILGGGVGSLVTKALGM